MTTKTAGLPGPPKEYESGNMFFFETKSGDLLSEYRNPRLTNDTTSPDDRQVLLVAPRHPGAGASTATCSSTPTTAAARR